MNTKQKKPTSSKLSPYHKKKYLQFIKKLGLESAIPKLEKTPFFWEQIEKRFVKLEIILEDFDIPPHTHSSIKDRIALYMEHYTVEFPTTTTSFTLFELFILFRSLYYSILTLFSEETKIYKQFKPWMDIQRNPYTLQIVHRDVSKIISIALNDHSYLEHYIYSYTFEHDAEKRGSAICPAYIYRIYRQKTKAGQFKLSGTNREAFTLIQYQRDLGKICTKKVCWQGKMYPVYIQSHALRRIEERIHVYPSMVYRALVFQAQFNSLREYRGRILVPVINSSLTPVRIGYLIGTITNSVLLIRTFLFISQDYTPEGDKLTQILELEMIDKGYLNLDKLEHFTKSNLKDDEILRPIFKASRLDHLFDIKETIPANEITENSQFIRDMLQLG